jgi:hypothetical protein
MHVDSSTQASADQLDLFASQYTPPSSLSTTTQTEHDNELSQRGVVCIALSALCVLFLLLWANLLQAHGS